MDFSTLSRRELQALCKKNKLPANLTNVAMADSLQALQHVEGIEELLNQSPERSMKGSQSVSRTASKTSTRRKPIIEESESSQQVSELPITPAAPSTRRRAPSASARQEKPLVQSAYKTRRSVRLLEKNMSKLSLDYESNMPSKMEELSSERSEKCDDSGSVDKGSNVQTESEAISVMVDVSEVSSEPKSDAALENEEHLKDDAHEHVKTDMMEVEDDSKLKSGPESEVSESKSASDVMVSEVIVESHEEGFDDADDKEHDGEGTMSLAAKVSDKVSAEVVDHVECQSLKVEESDFKTAKDQDSGSKSATLGEIEEAAKPKGLTLSLSVEQQNSLASKGSDMYGAAEGDYGLKFDFECSEDESYGAMDESLDKESESLKASGDDILEEESSEEDSDFVSSEDEMAYSVKQMSPGHLLAVHPQSEIPVAKIQEANSSEALVDVPVMLAEAKSPLAADQLQYQFPRPTLLKSSKSSGKKPSEVMSYIFDENEESIDGSASGDNKVLEHGGVEMKKDEKPTKMDGLLKEVDSMDSKSLRQLKKMLKQKLNIGDNKTGGKMVEKPRTALQEVPENQMGM